MRRTLVRQRPLWRGVVAFRAGTCAASALPPRRNAASASACDMTRAQRPFSSRSSSGGGSDGGVLASRAPAWYDEPDRASEVVPGMGLVGGAPGISPRKRRVAIYFGYASVRQPPASAASAARAHTGSAASMRAHAEGGDPAEGALLSAIWHAGGIRDMNAVRRMARGSRTDKGAHALVNVLSMDLLFRGDDPWDTDPFGTALADQVNPFLPPEVRVFAVRRATKSWNAHFSCSSRTYEYLLPAWALGGDGSAADSARRVRVMAEALARTRGAHSFHNFDARAPSHDAAQALSDASGAAEAPDMAREDAHADAHRAVARAAAPQFRVFASEQENAHLRPGGSQRRDVAEVRCEGVLAGLGAASAGGVVRVHVSGCSFLQNQVCMAVGAALWLARNELPPQLMRALLSPRVSAQLPCAPAETLLLAGSTFRVPPNLHAHLSLTKAALMHEHDAVAEESMTRFFNEQLVPHLDPQLGRDGAWAAFDEQLRAQFESPAVIADALDLLPALEGSAAASAVGGGGP